MVTADVSYPIVSADIVESENVKAVNTQPYVPDTVAAAEMVVFVVEGSIAETYVDTFVGR